MTAILADGNVLIALTVVDHVHHAAAVRWFDEAQPELATCPITQGTLLRFLLREGVGAPDAMAVLDQLRSAGWHHFWADDLPYEAAHLRGVIGHRQVTDAYLVALASHRGGRLATFDRGLSALHGDAVDLVEP
ncbi:MAG: TA system VapC family ribonuclease toxin [Actinomycetota bacterium]